ncbi:MAG: hypothetical protein JWN34_1096 [Bryobacterales bacterium]|nr:hypothetical protein [Bryobacterales bacterium]
MLRNVPNALRLSFALVLLGFAALLRSEAYSPNEPQGRKVARTSRRFFADMPFQRALPPWRAISLRCAAVSDRALAFAAFVTAWSSVSFARLGFAISPASLAENCLDSAGGCVPEAGGVRYALSALLSSQVSHFRGQLTPPMRAA